MNPISALLTIKGIYHGIEPIWFVTLPYTWNWRVQQNFLLIFINSVIFFFFDSRLFQILVKARDNGIPSKTTLNTAIVTVTIIRNIYAPFFQPSFVNVTISENTPISTSVASVSALDNDKVRIDPPVSNIPEVIDIYLDRPLKKKSGKNNLNVFVDIKNILIFSIRRVSNLTIRKTASMLTVMKMVMVKLDFTIEMPLGIY